MTRRMEYKQIKEHIEREGYVLVSTHYKNAKEKLHMKCSENHDYWVNWCNFKSGYRCKQCHVKKKTYTIDKIREELNERGYKLISTEYKNSYTPIVVECPKGHKYETTWKKIKHHNCSECYDKRRSCWQVDTLSEVVADRGFRLLSKEYKNNITAIRVECSKGHKYETTWLSLQKYGCRICNIENQKIGINKVREFVESQGYKIVTTEYTNATTKMHMICPEGHNYWATWDAFRQGYRCATCFKSKSKSEREIQNLYKHHSLQENNRQCIKPLELDLLFSQHKVAIEYCGLYWHSEAAPGDRIVPSYHRNKMDLCNEKDIRLLTIFEDEWLNHKDICISRINNALGICTQRIFARKCKVRQIDKKLAKEFLNRTHLQGYGRCKIAYGLFYQDTLMQVMTWGSPARAHTAKGKRVLEMKRFAGELDIIVVGGAGKLLKLGLKYAKENNYEILKSYCDLRWGTGNLYKKLGFVLQYESKYTPHYTDGKNRWRNQSLATNKKKEGKTEKKKSIERGLYKIYDCGHQTWEFNVNERERK